MKSLRIFCTLVFLCWLAGCADLKEVQRFAAESARLSGYTELTTRFRDTYQREQPYLTGEAERMARDNDRKRREVYPDLVKIHQGVSRYMQTLAKLAGDDTIDLAKPIGVMAGGIKSYPDLGIHKSQVDAFFNITKIISKWATSAAQQSAVREMVLEADEPMQTMLEGMIAIVRYYEKTNDNERETITGLFEVELPFASSPQDRLLATLAKAHLQLKSSEYQAAKRKYAEAERGLRRIAEGHRSLAGNIDKLSDRQTKAQIDSIARDIQDVRENLITLGS